MTTTPQTWRFLLLAMLCGLTLHAMTWLNACATATSTGNAGGEDEPEKKVEPKGEAEPKKKAEAKEKDDPQKKAEAEPKIAPPISPSGGANSKP